MATSLLSQLVSVIQPDPRKLIDAALIDQVLGLIEGIKPTDALEAMTATMLVGAQHAALESLRRASHPDQTPAGRALYQSLGLKAIRTFAQLLDTLYHRRSGCAGSARGDRRQNRGRGYTQIRRSILWSQGAA